jgi:hypothetical protein
MGGGVSGGGGGGVGGGEGSGGGGGVKKPNYKVQKKLKVFSLFSTFQLILQNIFKKSKLYFN